MTTRVLMTADTVGGVWTYAVELASALAARGCEVVLATMGRPLSPEQWADAAGFKVCESAYALEWMPDPWADVDRAGEWLLGLAEDVRPDVVHLNGYAHAALPWRAPTVVVAHSDVLSWWRHVRGCEAPPEWDEYRRRLDAGLAAAGVVVAPTSAVLDDLGRAGVVIPNGRSAGWVRDVPKERLVVAAGRVWDEAKGTATVEAVRGRVPYDVVAAGEGSATGPLPFAELGALLCRATAFAGPARYEPFGLTALEAGLAGCALVLGDIPSLREVWGDAAVYVPPGDDDALAAALTSLDPGAGARARDKAKTYPPDRMAASYLDLYGGLSS
jgi:glycosyltransferase involved in cell wall biosynthesis